MPKLNTNGNFTFIESQQGSVNPTTLSLIRSHTMRRVRHIKKLQAQRASASEQFSKPARSKGQPAPSEAATQVAKAVIQDLDIVAWARRTIPPDVANYIVVVEGVCPLDCVLQRAETLRTASHADVLADPGMVDFVNLLLDSEAARRGNARVCQADLISVPIQLGPLVLAYLEEHEQSSSWLRGIFKGTLVRQSMTNVGLYHSFLSMSLASASVTRPKAESRRLWHETKTIGIVRQHLDHRKEIGVSTKDLDIWALSLLGLQHALYGSSEVAEIHLRGIEQMVLSRGGIAALGFGGQVRHIVELLLAASRHTLSERV